MRYKFFKLRLRFSFLLMRLIQRLTGSTRLAYVMDTGVPIWEKIDRGIELTSLEKSQLLELVRRSGQEVSPELQGALDKITAA